jgi:transposase-like protein
VRAWSVGSSDDDDDLADGRAPVGHGHLLDSLPELTTFLRFPREHWSRIRHTNLIERTFGETRRCVKVIGRLPGLDTGSQPPSW